jgi:hypothetical protein
MEFTDFVKRCIGIFQEAKRKKEIAPRVARGRAGSCSAECENLIAVAVSGILPHKYALLVDYPLTVRRTGAGRAETFYPDIAILCESKLVGVLEIKNDLGYMSEDWANKSAENLDKLQSAESINYREDVNVPSSGLRSVEPARPMRHAVIVISGKNSHGRMAALQARNKCFVLMPKHHPNDFDVDRKVGDILQSPAGWNDMREYLSSQYQ